ncbi:MAG TPA: pyridoxamine 5'-phosphate oxidase family protein [Yinghuangia sp.]|uniref:pyridoxamine 5'-phosphate oxidase family protein n=1 Tax=Yinghuangia sp. YIM S10712 TaxID=3436930 RepID=UPI002CEF0A10|nr:pyridoxamine 5'-phosphate oxidase family protein [Yinghuangia sp.]
MTASGSSAPRLVEVSGAEALWLLDGSTVGRLVFTLHGLPAIRPARHVLEHGALVVRAAIPAAALSGSADRPAILAYHADEIDPAAAHGWSVTALGPATPVTDPHIEAHHRRNLPGWALGPHDTLLRLHPQSVTGHRLVRPAHSVPDKQRRGSTR